MFKIIKQNIFLKIDSTGLAIFRIFYMLVLMCEIRQLYYFRSLIYERLPIIEIDVEFIFKFWFIIIGLLFFGLFTRIATIINYLFSVIIFSGASAFEYHVFKTYVSINFLLIFIPISKTFSLDTLIHKLKYSNTISFFIPDKKVLAINYFVLVLLGIAFVYLDSVLYKFLSPMWMNGLGMWLPASLPMVTWNDCTWLLNQELLVKFLGYLTLLFETLFIFLFWYKPFRISLLIIGIFLHLGILIIFPIPWFALTAIALYMLMVPVSFWKKIGKWFRHKKPNYRFYYDSECPLCIKTVIVIQHFDIFNAVKTVSVQGNYQDDIALKGLSEEELFINVHGVNKKGEVLVGYNAYTGLFKTMGYTWPVGVLLGLPGISKIGKIIYNYVAGNRITTRCTLDNCPMPSISHPILENDDFITKGLNRLNITKYFWKFAIPFFILCQFIISWFSPLSQEVLIKIGLRYTRVNDMAIKLSELVQPSITSLLGISHHGVFLDGHFNRYNQIIKTEYCSNGTCKIVPLINDKGMPVELLRGSTWCNFNFGVVTSKINQKIFEKGIIPYLEFYKDHCLLKIHGANHFIFYVKNIEIPKKWQRNFLRKQINKPWEKVGEYSLDTDSFNWNNKMKDIYKNELN